jgi:Winged helix DNA-binding domain
VAVDGERRWLLPEDAGRLDDPPEGTRLLGPFDLFLQARDRDLLVTDPVRAKELWRTLGRLGGVLVDGEIAGTWRAKKEGQALTITVTLWGHAGRAGVQEQAERLADFRQLRLKTLVVDT